MEPFRSAGDVHCRCEECGGAPLGQRCPGPERHCSMCLDEGGGHEPLDALGIPTGPEFRTCDCALCDQRGVGYYPDCCIEDGSDPEAVVECPECMVCEKGTWTHRCVCDVCSGYCKDSAGGPCRVCVYGNGSHVDWCDGPCG
eukprot:tig00000459_g1148.t1